MPAMIVKASRCKSGNDSSQSISTPPTTLYLFKTREEILTLYRNTDVNHLQGSGDLLWSVMSKVLKHEETSAQLWWKSTGSLLATLLYEAKYSVTAQCDILLFYFLILAPQLGPHPQALRGCSSWKSFMTDDNIPIELSWEWGLRDKSPLVRLSIEPIGLDAGTPQDTLNEFATNAVVDNFQRIYPRTDLSLLHYFSKELLTYNVERGDNEKAWTTADHQSRSFLAFDFGETTPMLKAYFLPIFKAMETGQSTMALISQAIDKLSKLEGLKFPNYEILCEYLRTSTQGSKLQAEMFSIDCVSPASSRMKIYVRSQSTSFDSIRANMTLDGKLRQRHLDKGMVELEKLWKMVLLPAQFATANEELPRKDHRTAGILYYYDIKPRQAYPIPRLYIPVRHYGETDTAIAMGLTRYLKTRGQDKTATHYLKALRTI